MRRAPPLVSLLCLAVVASACKRGHHADGPSVPEPPEPPPATKTPPAAAPAEGEALLGVWEGPSGGLRERWTIAHGDHGWIVTGSFLRDGQEVGSFRGQDVRIDDNVLSFRQEYIRKPESHWTDGNQMTARADGSRLRFTWQTDRNQSGSGALERMGGAVVRANPKRKVNGPDDSGPMPPEPRSAIRPPSPSQKGPEPKAPAKKEPPKAEPQLPALTPEGKAELAHFDGTWDFKEFLLDGKKIDFGATWKFKGDTVGEYIGLSTPRRSGTFRPDSTQNPRAIDVHFTKGVGGAMLGYFRGVYEFNGDTLTICFGTDGSRPEEVVSPLGSHTMLMVFRRQK